MPIVVKENAVAAENMRQVLQILSSRVVRAVFSLALIGWLSYQIGTSQIIAEASKLRWQTLCLVTLLLAATNILIITPRWAAILAALGFKIGSTALLGSVFLGFLFNQVLPTAVGGDLLRVWRVRELGVPLATAIHSVLLDRMSGIFVVFVGTIVLLPFARVSILPVEALFVFAIGIPAACIIGVAIWMMSRVAWVWIGRLWSAARGLLASLSAVAHQPWALMNVLFLSVVGQCIVVATIALLATELNVHVSIVDYAVVSFTATLAASVPISLAGWGVREGAIVLLFQQYGVPAETAFAISLLFGTSLMLAALPGALLLLKRPTSGQNT